MNNVCVTSCYELEMLDEHTASLFNLLICNGTPPTPPPPLQIRPNNKKNLIISHSLVSLVYNNIMVHKNIDITLMSIFIKFDFVPNYQCNKANNLKRWLHILERSFRFLYSLLHNHDT